MIPYLGADFNVNGKDLNRVHSFEVAIPEERLDLLRRRLGEVELAPDLGNADWRYGVETDYLADLLAYWSDGFDWRAREREINRYEHRMTEVAGLPLHFLHIPGKGPAPIPLILTHGWPWTFWDFSKVIGPLSDPAAHGGDPADAFELIVPSLPGYCFSTPLPRTGVSPATIAAAWVELACDVLGHERFAVHGADWGLRVCAELGHAHADRLIGMHLAGAPIAGLRTDRPWAEAFAGIYSNPRAPLEDLVAWEATRAAHLAVHGLDPQTLAHALHDSPAGLCAWILERRRSWSDCGGDVESVFSRDELLTTMTLYWATGCIGSSLRLYWEAMRAPVNRVHDRTPIADTPTGVSLFLADGPPGYRWEDLDQRFDVRLRREHQRGGHFAAAEQPQAVITDIRDTFRPLR
jgi:pimeloyl-ACP methyl ester carboxylesterase